MSVSDNSTNLTRPSRPARRRSPAPPPAEGEAPPAPLSGDLLTRALPAVLDHFQIVDWDVLLVGDGSGYSWNIGCGWAGALIDRQTMSRKLLWGGWSAGTIMIAELMPYIHALAWYESAIAKARRAHLRRGVLKVHVICDNKTIVDQGNHLVDRRKMLPWWSCWAAYLRNGYTARFHQVPGHEAGAQVGLNVLCDHVSRCARLLVQTPTLADMVPDLPGISVYDVNPA